MRQSVKDRIAVAKNVSCGVLLVNWRVARCHGRCFDALYWVSLFFWALFDANTVSENIIDVPRLKSLSDIIDVEVTVLLVSFVKATNFVVSVDWCNKLARISNCVAKER